jgi:hypothetical protein
VKFSFRQILASAAGAVIAALIASSFGVTGTIVGVAIGSMAATLGTALVSPSIERGQKVVKEAAVRVPGGTTTSSILRRMGATGASGGATSSVDGGREVAEPTEVVGAVGQATSETESVAAPVDAPATERTPVDLPEDDDEPAPQEIGTTTAPLLPSAVLEGAGVVRVTGGAGLATAAGAESADRERRFSWKVFAGTAAIVFVLALGFVTAVELIANRATVFNPSPGTPATTTTSTPSTTSTSTSSSTSTTSTSSTSSTTSSTTSTTTPSATTSTTARSTTTTNNPGSASTTTTTTAAAP